MEPIVVLATAWRWPCSKTCATPSLNFSDAAEDHGTTPFFPPTPRADHDAAKGLALAAGEGLQCRGQPGLRDILCELPTELGEPRVSAQAAIHLPVPEFPLPVDALAGHR